MANEILDNDDYLKILQQRFNTQCVKFMKAEFAPLSENIEGYMGDHFILKLTYKIGETEDIESFFVKTKPTKSEVQKETAAFQNGYVKETFLYNFLFKEFEKMGYNISFAPKSYYCKNGDTIIMEDLRPKGFKILPRNISFDIDHCKMAIYSLATYHASTIAYEETKSNELGKDFRLIDEYPDVFNVEFFFPKSREGFGYRFIQALTRCATEVCKLMPEPEEWKKIFVEKIKNYDSVNQFWTQIDSRKTCTHGDLWSNNLLFNYSNNEPNHCCLVDFQLLRYHHSAYDALLVIYSNTTREFRKQHLLTLLVYYYQIFESILKDYGFQASNILTKEEFLNAAKVLEPVAIIQAAAIRSFTDLPIDIANDAVNSGGDHFEEVLIRDRSKHVVAGFQADEEFKKRIMDDMYDLYDHL